MVDLVGIAAGALTTASFLPQVVKTWRSRCAEDLSLGMLMIFNLGVALWEVYGIAIGSRPVIAANGLTLVLGVVMLILKLRFSQPPGM